MHGKATPLKNDHIKSGAKMVEFAGWYMPVEYKGLRQEHEAVRERVGLFDVSHMGEIRIQGRQALAAVERLTTNYAGKLKAGQAQYSLLSNDKGGVVDDLIVYCMEQGTDYLLCVNASNTDKDLNWIVKNDRSAEITNESSMWGQIAVQGPRAMELLSRVLPGEPPAPFEFRTIDFAGVEMIIARTGYTGEDGVEIFVPSDVTSILWQGLLTKGQDLGVEPVGLCARDTLRTEMKYPLYGHELDDNTNPYSAGLGWVVKPDKKDFIGCHAMLAEREKGLKRKLIGFKMRERGIPRQGYKLYSEMGAEVGHVTSGTLSPTLNESIGIGYIDANLGLDGTEFLVDIRGRKAGAQVVATSFVKTKKQS